LKIFARKLEKKEAAKNSLLVLRGWRNIYVLCIKVENINENKKDSMQKIGKNLNFTSC